MFEVIPLFSGSSGNSVFFRSGESHFLIDAGMSCRAMCQALRQIGSAPEKLRCVFVTHEHSDHIAGLEMLCKRYDLSVYINSRSAQELSRTDRFPYLCSHISILDADNAESLYGISVKAFRTPHDSCGSVGYRFDDDDDSFAYATDMGYVTRCVAKHVFGCKTVVFESNHDVTMLKNSPYPAYLKSRILSYRGHLSNEACAAFLPHLAQNGTTRIILGHLSSENNTRELAYQTAKDALSAAGFSHIEPEVAPRSILK